MGVELDLAYAGITSSDIESVNMTSDSITITTFDGQALKFVNTNKQIVRLVSDVHFSEIRTHLVNEWFSKCG